MGSALARAFLKHGYSTGVWNRTKSKCEPLAALGARIAPTVQDAAAASDVIVVNVTDYITRQHRVAGRHPASEPGTQISGRVGDVQKRRTLSRDLGIHETLNA